MAHLGARPGGCFIWRMGHGQERAWRVHNGRGKRPDRVPIGRGQMWAWSEVGDAIGCGPAVGVVCQRWGVAWSVTWPQTPMDAAGPSLPCRSVMS